MLQWIGRLMLALAAILVLARAAAAHEPAPPAGYPAQGPVYAYEYSGAAPPADPAAPPGYAPMYAYVVSDCCQGGAAPRLPAPPPGYAPIYSITTSGCCQGQPAPVPDPCCAGGGYGQGGQACWGGYDYRSPTNCAPVAPPCCAAPAPCASPCGGEIHLGDAFFWGAGGVGPDAIYYGGGGGGGYAYAGAGAGASAYASASASARVSIGGGPGRRPPPHRPPHKPPHKRGGGGCGCH